MNIAIGSDDLGVKDNTIYVSHGGHIIRNFLKDGKYVLVNNAKDVIQPTGIQILPLPSNYIATYMAKMVYQSSISN